MIAKDRILIIKLAGIGDFVLATPALKALSSNSPAEIVLLTSGRLKGLAERCPYVSSVVFLEEPFASPRRWPVNLKILWRLRKRQFRLVVNLHTIGSWQGALKMWFLMRLIAGRKTVGFFSGGKGFFFNEKVPDPSSDLHETQKHLELVRSLGYSKLPEAEPEVWISGDEDQELNDILRRQGVSDKDRFLIGLHPGGNKAGFLWPPGHFALLARHLYRVHRAKILLTGEAKEKVLTEEVRQRAEIPMANLCGELPLSLIPAFLRRLQLFISNDTGLAHIAAAAGVPSVTLFGPKSRSVFAPLHRPGKGLLIRKEGKGEMTDLSVEEVIEQVERSLPKGSQPEQVPTERLATKIRVAHLITRLDSGGSSENTLLTLKGLDPRRYSLTLLYGRTVDPPREALRELEAKGVSVICLEELVRSIRPDKDLIALRRLYRLFREGHFDIVHTHSSKAGVLGRLAAHWAGVRHIVHTPHGHVFYGYFDPLTNGTFLQLERWMGRVTDRLITLTQRGKEEHVAYRVMPAEKIVPIYSGIELERFQQEIPVAPEFQQFGPHLLIGVVGRLVPIKGHRYLIESVPLVLREVPTARFLLIGDGPLQKELERRCRALGLSEVVFFLGEREDIRPLVKGLHLLVLCSLNEGMGRVLLEAQAMGKPVIGTRVGGIPDAIKEGETGLLVPPQDPKALAEAIVSLLKDPVRREGMGHAAKRWVGETFSAGEMVFRISKLYEELLQTS